MKIFTKLFLTCLLLSSIELVAQRTFETLLGSTGIFGVDQNPDGTYILSFDSSGDGIMKLDECGRHMWTAFPFVRRNDEVISTISYNPFTGGYIAGGNSPDSTGVFDNEPFLMLLDANGNVTSSRLLAAGTLGGIVSSVRATPDSGFVAGVYLTNNGGANASTFIKIDPNLADEWDFSGAGSQIGVPSVDINADNEYLFSSFNSTASTAPTIRHLDAAGMLLNTFVVPDTFQGGCLFMRNVAVDHTADGNYIIGATLSPITSFAHPYIVKLDGQMNVIWQKILRWGQSAQVLSVLSTPDSGSISVINKSDTVFFLRHNSNGDSLWTKTYTGIGTVKANYMRKCTDGGYVLSGRTTDGVNAFGVVLKLDSLLQLLPPVCIEADPSTTICPGSTLTLSADSSYQYQWSTGDTTQSIVVDTIGTYSVMVTDSATGLTAMSEPISVNFYTVSNPVINLLVTILVSTPAVSYQWFFNGDTMHGETTIQVIPQLSGNYSVVVVDSNGCVLSSAPFLFLMPGIEKLEAQTVFVITRVNTELVEVAINTNQSGTLRLIDIRGVLVKEMEVSNVGTSTLTIPVSELSTGIYSMVWYSSGTVQVEKLLISK